jgi:hypothetical protein
MISIKFGDGGSHQKLKGEYDFGPHQSDITFTSEEAQTEFNRFSPKTLLAQKKTARDIKHRSCQDTQLLFETFFSNGEY